MKHFFYITAAVTLASCASVTENKTPITSVFHKTVKLVDSAKGLRLGPIGDRQTEIRLSNTKAFDNSLYSSLTDRKNAKGLNKVEITFKSGEVHKVTNLPPRLEAWATAVQKTGGETVLCPKSEEEILGILAWLGIAVDFAGKAVEAIHDWKTYKAAKNYHMVFWVDKDKSESLKGAQFLRKSKENQNAISQCESLKLENKG